MRLSLLFVAAILAAQEPVRFDFKVRNLYFAGMGGDRGSLEKAMAITTETLKSEPNHPEALVWHGGGVFFLSGEKFRNGDMQGGMEMFQKGTSMMDRAVELAPRNIGVLIPRGSGYMAASRTMPEQMGRPLLEKGLADFEKAWDMQKGDLSHFSQHSIGELWFGIADGNARLGKTERAKEFFTMLKDRLPGTPWAKKAEKWFADGKLGAADGRCVGCHTGSPKAFQN